MRRNVLSMGLWLGLLSVAFLLGGVGGQTPDPIKEQPKKGRNSPQHAVANLDFLLDMKNFQNPMSLKEALSQIMDQMAGGGQEVPILVDAEAFKEDNPDAPSVYDTPVQFPPFPRRMRVSTALRLILARVTPPNATYIVREGTIEITTYTAARRDGLLRQRISGEFNQRPLAEVLRDLAERSGMSVLVDPRTGERVKTAVSATFRGDISLEAALHLLTDMAELKAVVLPSGVYITTPENAEKIRKEQKHWVVPPNSGPGVEKRVEAA